MGDPVTLFAVRASPPHCLQRWTRVPLTDAAVLERRLSPDRLAPYRQDVGGDLRKAFELYEWNARMGATFWRTLGHVEVLVRNAMHDQLTTWSLQQHGESRWYLDPGGIFTDKTTESIEAAVQKLRAKRRDETTGRVVAELSWGFWRFLLISSYDRSLWLPCLRHAWPAHSLRQTLYDPMDRLNDLRNRIAHHEPIYNRPLRDLHTTALTLAEWTCPATAEWIRAQCEVLDMLKTRPWTRPCQTGQPTRRSGGGSGRRQRRR
ncbi:Abi family protein [Dactylosporangium matsuzakiense]|nr:Abi family protein [Dactylosporangium matsuzakiense]